MSDGQDSTSCHEQRAIHHQTEALLPGAVETSAARSKLQGRRKHCSLKDIASASVPHCRDGAAASVPHCRDGTAASVPHCRDGAAASVPHCRDGTAASVPHCRDGAAASVSAAGMALQPQSQLQGRRCSLHVDADQTLIALFMVSAGRKNQIQSKGNL